MSAGEIHGYRRRVIARREQLRQLPRQGRGRLGPADPETGERWDRGNVLAHLAELLPFWCDQVERIRAGASELGRGEEGYARRRQAIQDWAGRDEDELRLEVEAGAETLLRLLDELAPGDLDRRLTYRNSRGEREVELRFVLEELLIAHLEAHLQQLQELG